MGEEREIAGPEQGVLGSTSDRPTARMFLRIIQQEQKAQLAGSRERRPS